MTSVDFSDTWKTSSESLQTVQQSYSENNKLSQTGSLMPVFDSNNTQATMSQNSSFVPGFDSNNTLVGANTIEHHKVLPEMPNQDENDHFMLENGPLKPFAVPNLPAGNTQQQIEHQQKTNLQGISLQSEQSNSALVKV